jgi:hypothetical protein
LLVLVVIAGLIALGLVQRWRGGPGAAGELDALVAELDEREPDWRLDDVEKGREQVPEADNSARLLTALAKRYPRNWADFEALSPREGTPANERLDAARLAKLIETLDAVAALRPEARRLADMRRGRHRLAVDLVNPYMILLQDQQETRQTASVLQLDAIERAHAGDVSGALLSVRAGVNTSRDLGDEPLIISQLIRIACFLSAANTAERALALGEADEKALADLQSLLIEDEKHNGVLVAWRGERAAMHVMLKSLVSGKVRLRDLATHGIPDDLRVRDTFMPWSIRGMAREEHPALLRLMNQAVENARLPEGEQLAAEKKLDAEIRSQAGRTRLVRVVMPAHFKINESHRRKVALNRCLIALLAVERYRLKEKRWPDSLEALKPALLKDIPLDPFDGKPIRYRKVADGVVVYTVGHDGADDGGNLDRNRPLTRGTDLGYRLWDVASRNQPASGAKAP